jgi:DNA-binding CsgD family transcriptional regulator
VRELARRALAEGALLRERGPEAPEIALAAIALVLADAPDEAVAALDAAAEEARRRGSAVGYATALCWRGFAHHHRGDVDAAAADAEVCLEAEGAKGWRLLPTALATLAFAHVRGGDLDAAERTLAPAELDRQPEDGGSRVMLYGARAELLAARHQPEAAVTDLRAVRRRFEPWGATSPALVPTRSRAARLLAALGRTEEAASLAAEELRLARTSGSPRALGLALQGLAATEPLDKRIATFEQATAHLRDSADRYAEAEVLCDLGATLRRARRPSDARQPLRRALDLAHRSGAAALAARAREELVASGARPRRNATSGRDALTPAERRVADLAADGLGNREIAQTLFLSPKTVEVYLTRSYRKLGIRTRRQLPDALAAKGSAHGRADA